MEPSNKFHTSLGIYNSREAKRVSERKVPDAMSAFEDLEVMETVSFFSYLGGFWVFFWLFFFR